MKKTKLFSVCISLALVFTLFAGISPVGAAAGDKALMTDFSGSVKTTDWRISSKPDGTVYVKDGKLNFDGAQDNSFFGPQGTYGDFALAFDIVGYEGNSSWLGLSFGLPNPDSFFAEPEPYLLLFTNDSVMLLKNKVADTVAWDDPAQRWIPADHALATNEEPLNVKVVLKEGKLKVYYKLQSEAASVLDTPRAVFSNLPDIAGYINLTTSGNDKVQGYFSLDNVKVFNDPDADTSVAISAPAKDKPSDGKDKPSTVPAAKKFIIVGATGYKVDPATGNIWKGNTYIPADKANLAKLPREVLQAARAAKAANKAKK
ncbi:hypothetical protein [Cohnella soli]|uniref:Uncharacterized protein n=1 Tax=Cohnella soli TaxID=425005 RepID=A0ABW0HPT7_9BACL